MYQLVGKTQSKSVANQMMPAKLMSPDRLALTLGNDPDGMDDTGDVAEKRQQDV